LLDGSSTLLDLDNPVLTLGSCKIVESSNNTYQVDWNTGEILNVTDYGNHLDLSSSLSWIDGLGSIEGLLASKTDPDSWRVTGTASLFGPVPESSSLAILSVGIGLTVLAARRRKVSVKCSRRER
jgi:hypothetical protein